MLKNVILTDWCRERKTTTPLLKMSTTELDQNLSRFYVEARTKKGEEYSRSALLGFTNAVERHLNNNEVTLKIAKNNLFQKSNKILDAKLRINRRAGKENVQHKPVIISADLAKIRESFFPFHGESSWSPQKNLVLGFPLLVPARKKKVNETCTVTVSSF